jgi:uncharacterized membrane protein
MTNQIDSTDSNQRIWTIVIWALYLASYFTFSFTGIIGLIIAYTKRGDLADTPFASHLTSAIRTFWISLIIGVAGLVLSFVGIGVVVLILLSLWYLFRVVRGLVRAIDGKTITDPEGWL